MHRTCHARVVRPRIDITFHDAACAQRLLVMTRHFVALDQARATFEALLPVEGYTTFVASIQVADNVFEHRPLDAMLVEHLTSQPLPDLLARARTRTPVVFGNPPRSQ